MSASEEPVHAALDVDQPKPRSKVSLWMVLAALLGIIAGTVIVAYYGFGAVGSALATAGWTGFIVVSLVHLVFLAFCGLSWWVLVPPPEHYSPRVFVWGRLIRDAGSEVLPLSQIGGYVMGARAAIIQGVQASTAMATTIVDVTLELMAQLAYTALGLGLLVWLHPGSEVVWWVGAGLGVAIVVTAGFVIAQRKGIGVLERLAQRLSRDWLGGKSGATPLQDVIHRLYQHRRGLKAGFMIHLASWIASGVEVWIALRFLDAPLDFASVLAIESLLYAIRSVAFAIPNAVGVQEGAYVMLGGIFGLSPQTALALSLLKRGRDLFLGVPSLLLWQALEGRYLLKRPKTALAGQR